MGGHNDGWCRIVSRDGSRAQLKIQVGQLNQLEAVLVRVVRDRSNGPTEGLNVSFRKAVMQPTRGNRIEIGDVAVGVGHDDPVRCAAQDGFGPGRAGAKLSCALLDALFQHPCILSHLLVQPGILQGDGSVTGKCAQAISIALRKLAWP